jgi:signal peptidase
MRAALTLRRLDRASTLLCVVAVAALAATGAATLAGGTLLVERSDSMRPALSAGDLLVTRPVPAGAIGFRDVVTFADAARGGRLVTHRVVGIERRAGAIVFTTRGDANTAAETFAVPRHARVRRMSLRARGAGRAVIALRRVPAWALLLAAATVMATPPILRRGRRT